MSKCKHWDDQTLTYEKESKWHSKGLVQRQCPVCRKWFWPHEWAKKPTPKKPKMVRKIKGYINLAGVSVAHSIEKDYHHRVYSDKAGALSEAWLGCDTVPCTILIDEKYLRRKP